MRENQKKTPDHLNKIPDIISKKKFIDKDELSAEKMIKIWESLDNKKLSKKNNLLMFKVILKISNLRRIIGKIKKNLFPTRFGVFKENYKFPFLEKRTFTIVLKDLKVFSRLMKK